MEIQDPYLYLAMHQAKAVVRIANSLEAIVAMLAAGIAGVFLLYLVASWRARKARGEETERQARLYRQKCETRNERP